jgi:hypothetical protein
MSLIRETAFYNDNNITGSAYNISNKKLSVIFKDGHIDEVQLSDKQEYDFFKTHENQSTALEYIKKK